MKKVKINTNPKWSHWEIYIDNFAITIREVIASIVILSIMLAIGTMISGNIKEGIERSKKKYNQAVHIESNDMFKHALNTSRGYAFIYGELKSIDSVSIDDIEGEYMYIRKEKYIYTMHTRTVCSGSGKNETCRIETYWTWDYNGKQEWNANDLAFCNIKFKYEDIDTPSSYYLGTINESSHIKYKYYVCDTNYEGTMFANLKNKTMEETSFYKKTPIVNTLENKLSGSYTWLYVFRSVWIILSIGLIGLFYYAENKWLQ